MYNLSVFVLGSEHAEEETLECRTITVENLEMGEQAINTHLLCTELNEIEDEIEEDKVPNTPASIEGLLHLRMKLLFFFLSFFSFTFRN